MVAALLAVGVSACGSASTKATSDTTGAAAGAASASATAMDAKAEIAARKAQVAMEVYATDNGGAYTGVDAAALKKIEPSVPTDLEIQADSSSYAITAHSGSGNSFTVARDPGGATKLTCSKPGVGACSASASW